MTSSGFSYEEIVGHRVNDLPVFDDLEQLKRSTELVIKEGSLQNLEFTFRTKSGDRSRRSSLRQSSNSKAKEPRLHRERQSVQRETEAKLRASE